MQRQSHAHILVTRPKEQSLRFAAGLRAALPDAAIVISALMQVEFLRPARPDGDFAAVIFTSETGVAGAMAGLPRRAYCVGVRTAQTARAAGFQTLHSNSDWRGLFDLIKADHRGGRLLFLHAAEAAPDLCSALNSAGFETVSLPVYRQNPQKLTPKAVTLLHQSDPVLVPLFSARSAILFQQEFMRLGGISPLCFAALSPQVAAAFTLPNRQTIIAQNPSSDAMISALIQLAGLR